MKAQRKPVTGQFVVALIATVLLAIGSFGPWATFGPLHLNGLDDGRDGWVSLVGAALAGILLWRYYTAGTRRHCVLLFVIAVLVVIVGAIDASDLSGNSVSFFGADIGPSVGWGLWLVIIAGCVLGATAIMLRRQVPRDGSGTTQEQPAPAPADPA